MKKFFIRVILFLPSFIAFLWLLNYIVDHGLKKTNDYHYEVWNDIYASRINADMLICGSSRAFKHISPRILDSTLHLKSYNIGLIGWSCFMQLVRFDIYLKHNSKPKFIIQNVDVALLKDKEEFYGYDQFLPYIDDPAIVSSSKPYKGGFTIPDLYFPFFKYNHQYYNSVIGLTTFFKLRHKHGKLNKGFWVDFDPWDGSFDKYKEEFPTKHIDTAKECAFQSNMLLLFDQYLNYCSRNNIRVIMVYTPVFYEMVEMDPCMASYKKLFRFWSKKYNMPYLDYTTNSICRNKAYFSNSTHLNINGAEVFSRIVASDIKKYVDSVQFKAAN